MKMTQDALAKEIGLTRNYVNLIENGKETPSSRTVSDIARILNVNETWLRTGEGEMHAPVSSASRRGTIYGIAINKGNKYIDSFVAALEKLSDEDLEKVYKLAKNWVDENEKETEC